MMEQFLKLPPAQKAGVLAAILAVLGAGGYFLLIDPVISEATQSTKDLNSTDAQLAGLAQTAKEEELAKLRKRKDDLVEQDKDNRKMLPMSDEVPDLIENLQHDAVACNLEVSRFERLETRHMNLVDAVPVRMTVSGSMIEVLRFLRIYASPDRRVIHLRRLSIENVPLDQGELMKELRETYTPEQKTALLKQSPTQQVREQIDVQERARKKAFVRATFTAYAYTWTGKPPVEGAEAEQLGKRKRT